MTPPLRAILVSVDYADLLRVTLRANRHHFDEVCVVTSAEPRDVDTIQIAVDHGCKVWETDAFYRDGALFNKWLALEEGLDFFGRHGLLVVMDADVIWPRRIEHPEYVKGCLYTPYRRMMTDLSQPIPHEALWDRFPLHPQQYEFAGFTQIFHADDPHLPSPPWHQTDWRHAGGADSFFQALWPDSRKIRPRWECLHLGEAGRNWAGRATPYLGGGQHPQAHERMRQLRKLIRSRTPGHNRFAAEKIQQTLPSMPSTGDSAVVG